MKRSMLWVVLLGFGTWSACMSDGAGLGRDGAAKPGSNPDGIVYGQTDVAPGLEAGASGEARDTGAGGASGNEDGGSPDWHGSSIDVPPIGGSSGNGGTAGAGGTSSLDAGDRPRPQQDSSGIAGSGSGDAQNAPDLPDATVSPPADGAMGGQGGSGGSADDGTGGSGGSGGGPGVDAGDDTHFSRDAAPSPDSISSVWNLVWADDFDGDANTTVDPAKWNIITWNPGKVNNEEQKYTARTSNVFQDGSGNLVLRGLHDAYAIPGKTYPYTSGRIDTQGIFTFKFGRVEVRAKLPAGKGSFPGIVLMGPSNLGWPDCGEFGLAEQWGQEKNWLYCSAYAGNASGDLEHQQVTFPDSTMLSADFHTYALEWYTDRAVFFIDGDEVAQTQFNATSPFYSNKMYLVLDLALGGDMGGNIDNAAFPMDMVVDYVRVYTHK